MKFNCFFIGFRNLWVLVFIWLALAWESKKASILSVIMARFDVYVFDLTFVVEER